MKTHNSLASRYYENTHNTQPNKLLVSAMDSHDFAPDAQALDLGCGAGRDTKYLLDRKFSVTAVDREELAGAYLEKLPNQNALKFVVSDFASFDYRKYDVINSHFALPFNPKESFDEVFAKVKNALKPGGLLVCQLFGQNDEWNTTDSKMTFHTRAEVDTLLNGLEVKSLKEVDEDGALASGRSKHWHVYHIVAMKPVRDEMS